MFLIERIRRLPLAMILGLALMAAGGVLDIAIHLGPAAAEHHHVHESFASAHAAHLVGIAGMALVLAGVVVHGARRQRTHTTGGPDSNAHR